jgi:hypothetical protein
MILRRAQRLTLLHWQGRLHPHLEKTKLPEAQRIMCAEISPEDGSPLYHVMLVPSKCNMLYYISQFEQERRLRESLHMAEIAEGIRLAKLAEMEVSHA